MMTPQDILAKNHPAKHKSRLYCLNGERKPKKPQDAQRLVCSLPGCLRQYNTVVDPGEGPRTLPLFLDQNEAQRAEKCFFFQTGPHPI